MRKVLILDGQISLSFGHFLPLILRKRVPGLTDVILAHVTGLAVNFDESLLNPIHQPQESTAHIQSLF